MSPESPDQVEVNSDRKISEKEVKSLIAKVAKHVLRKEGVPTKKSEGEGQDLKDDKSKVVDTDKSVEDNQIKEQD